MKESAKFSGWFYLLFGLLLLWVDSSILSCRYIPEPYNGWRLGRWIWFIFGGVLTFLGFYILVKN